MNRSGITNLPLHGGKDSFPYPVDRKNYDRSIHILKESINNAKINNKDRHNAIMRLNRIIS